MKKKSSIFASDGFQTFLTSIICIIIGLLVGYIALLIINPAGANDTILVIIKNFMSFNKASKQLNALGTTLVKMAPLLMCSLSVLFAYKVSLFNIGAAGQYTIGAGAALICALMLHLPWYMCVLSAILAGAMLGALSGLLKAFFNVNEVISSIMFNWMALYAQNMVLANVKEPATPYTENIATTSANSLLPTFGLDNLFAGNKYVTIAIPLAIIISVLIWILLNKTKLGYELKATGYNKNAAKYAGMKEKKNIILTMAIAGGLAGLGGAFMYLTGYEKWQTTASAVPAMGFNGIAGAFLGGLNPIGAIFSSYFIQHIMNAGAYIDKTMYSSQISDFITAIIIYLSSFSLFIKLLINNRRAKKLEEANINADSAVAAVGVGADGVKVSASGGVSVDVSDKGVKVSAGNVKVDVDDGGGGSAKSHSKVTAKKEEK